MSRRDVIHSRIWEEEPEPDDPFVARTCYCAVTGDFRRLGASMRNSMVSGTASGPRAMTARRSRISRLST